MDAHQLTSSLPAGQARLARLGDELGRSRGVRRPHLLLELAQHLPVREALRLQLLHARLQLRYLDYISAISPPPPPPRSPAARAASAAAATTAHWWRTVPGRVRASPRGAAPTPSRRSRRPRPRHSREECRPSLAAAPPPRPPRGSGAPCLGGGRADRHLAPAKQSTRCGTICATICATSRYIAPSSSSSVCSKPPSSLRWRALASASA